MLNNIKSSYLAAVCPNAGLKHAADIFAVRGGEDFEEVEERIPCAGCGTNVPMERLVSTVYKRPTTMITKEELISDLMCVSCHMVHDVTGEVVDSKYKEVRALGDKLGQFLPSYRENIYGLMYIETYVSDTLTVYKHKWDNFDGRFHLVIVHGEDGEYFIDEKFLSNEQEKDIEVGILRHASRVAMRICPECDKRIEDSHENMCDRCVEVALKEASAPSDLASQREAAFTAGEAHCAMCGTARALDLGSDGEILCVDCPPVAIEKKIAPDRWALQSPCKEMGVVFLPKDGQMLVFTSSNINEGLVPLVVFKGFNDNYSLEEQRLNYSALKRVGWKEVPQYQ